MDGRTNKQTNRQMNRWMDKRQTRSILILNHLVRPSRKLYKTYILCISCLHPAVVYCAGFSASESLNYVLRSLLLHIHSLSLSIAEWVFALIVIYYRRDRWVPTETFVVNVHRCKSTRFKLVSILKRADSKAWSSSSS